MGPETLSERMEFLRKHVNVGNFCHSVGIEKGFHVYRDYWEECSAALKLAEESSSVDLVLEIGELQKRKHKTLALADLDAARLRAHKKGATGYLNRVKEHLKISGATLEEIGSNQAEFDELMRLSVNWDDHNAQARAVGHPNSRTW
ncbi:MAG: hypothetical protein PHN19_02365 [Patescibacteria group bacterium]|nr:hypothetical protein [Patescibacteria group bacterium]